ncbi:MAG: poly-gamma-glutamate synthesis protein (capsule biosynthesis protein) [Burkholderiaceae bacterium]|nr:poly-gamma-glutamate synthesis protein (capsule biosynthesis protein) [Burkholderiaceae bacterium]
MLGRGVNQILAGMMPEEPWGDTLPLLKSADLRMVNLECAITNHKQEWERTRKAFHFRADPAAVRVLRAGHIDICSLANNHTLDFEEQGLLDTMSILDANGIAYAGAGCNDEEAARPAIVTAGKKGVKVAMIAFTDNEPAFASGRVQPGTNYMPVGLDVETFNRIETAIQAARKQGAEIVVFSNHCGPNMVQRPIVEFREFARAVIALGADIYYGHSAHVFQGVEIFRGKPILYDTGNFIDDYAVDPFMRNDWSFLFRVTMDGRKLKRLELFPVKLSLAKVELAHGNQWTSIVQRMELLCAEMGTKLLRDGRHLVYQSS